MYAVARSYSYCLGWTIPLAIRIRPPDIKVLKAMNKDQVLDLDPEIKQGKFGNMSTYGSQSSSKGSDCKAGGLTSN
jgi:hypothetical protein